MKVLSCSIQPRNQIGSLFYSRLSDRLYVRSAGDGEIYAFADYITDGIGIWINGPVKNKGILASLVPVTISGNIDIVISSDKR